MENATKALLIAAAVLVAILIISLGLVVYNMASETINSVNFSGQEITAFNVQFKQYEGDNVRGSQVNAMLNTVLSSNMKSRAEGLTAPANGQTSPKFIRVVANQALGTGGNGTNMANLEGAANTLGNIAADTSRLYRVVLTYDNASGFVSIITVTNS